MAMRETNTAISIPVPDAMFLQSFRLKQQLPIEGTASEVGVYEKRNNVWRQQFSLALTEG